MEFLPLYLDGEDKTLTLNHFSFNLFKIAFYYEEDQLETISKKYESDEARRYILDNYHLVAQEAVYFIRILNAFMTGHYTFEEHQNYFDDLVKYFHIKEKDLKDDELSNFDRFEEWLASGECKYIEMESFPF